MNWAMSDIGPFRVCSQYSVPLTGHQRTLVRSHYRSLVPHGRGLAKRSAWRLSLTYALANQALDAEY